MGMYGNGALISIIMHILLQRKKKVSLTIPQDQVRAWILKNPTPSNMFSVADPIYVTKAIAKGIESQPE